MSGRTINEDGTPVLIEAVATMYHTPYRFEFDSIEDAIGFLNSGEDHGDHSSVGVFVDGEPHSTDHYVNPPGRPPTDTEADVMRREYAEARNR